ncbi:MAG: glycosyltransferase family 2 protein [Elusimicrobia bacterium]|nr:glycosyltransferase family 2 protein [Elusimicrobiota bacterium]
MTSPKVCVVVLNWNRLAEIRECLSAVCELEYPNFKVLIVDNGSEDGSLPALRRDFPGAEFIENGANLGYAGGNNVGIRRAFEAGAEYVWLLNNDAVAHPECLALLVEAASRVARPGMVAPAIYRHEEREHLLFSGAWINFEAQKLEVPRDAAQRAAWEADPGRCPFITGTAPLLSRRAVEKAGALDEGFFCYFEDNDYSVKVWRAGLRGLVEPRAKVWHRGNSKEWPRKRPPYYSYYVTRNRYAFWMRYLPLRRKLGYSLRYCGRYIRHAGTLRGFGQTAQAEASLDGLWAGLRGERGPWNRSTGMPKALKRLALSRPYLLGNFLEGQWGRMAGDMLKWIH